jgi:hypothetical protein
MSQSIRFLGVAVMAWAGVRAISLGLVPGTDFLAFDLPQKPAARPAFVAPPQLSQVPPMASNPASYSGPPLYPGYGHPPYRAYGAAYAGAYPVYMPVPAMAARGGPPVVQYISVPSAVSAPPAFNPYLDSDLPTESWPETAFAAPVPSPKVTPSFNEERAPAAFDRLQLSSWAMLRATPGLASLAGTGTLGGSQAGARLLWRFNPHLSASLRASAPINSRRGGEAALGVRYQPFASIPVAITAERRKAFGQYGAGRNAFAAFVEAGLYGQSLPLNSSLDTYLQAGIVGARTRDWFVDGQAAVTRPVYKNLSAGFGVWGGAQPGISRLDAGPRLSLRVGKRMRVHADYRYKLMGNAQPGSGGVVTIAGDF